MQQLSLCHTTYAMCHPATQPGCNDDARNVPYTRKTERIRRQREEPGEGNGKAQCILFWLFPPPQEKSSKQQDPGQNHEVSLWGPPCLFLSSHQEIASPHQNSRALQLIYTQAKFFTAALRTDFPRTITSTYLFLITNIIKWRQWRGFTPLLPSLFLLYIKINIRRHF